MLPCFINNNPYYSCDMERLNIILSHPVGRDTKRLISSVQKWDACSKRRQGKSKTFTYPLVC